MLIWLLLLVIPVRLTRLISVTFVCPSQWCAVIKQPTVPFKQALIAAYTEKTSEQTVVFLSTLCLTVGSGKLKSLTYKLHCCIRPSCKDLPIKSSLVVLWSVHQKCPQKALLGLRPCNEENHACSPTLVYFVLFSQGQSTWISKQMQLYKWIFQMHSVSVIKSSSQFIQRYVGVVLSS